MGGSSKLILKSSFCGKILEGHDVLCFGLVAGSCWYIRSVFKVISDMQGVAMNNLLPSMVCVELSILGRISQKVAMS